MLGSRPGATAHTQKSPTLTTLMREEVDTAPRHNQSKRSSTAVPGGGTRYRMAARRQRRQGSYFTVNLVVRQI